MGQHIYFGAMCDIVANSHINVMKGAFIKKHWLHGHNMSYRRYANLWHSWHLKVV